MRNTFLAAMLLAFLPLGAQASTFNFSYTFQSGDVVTGSLSGDKNGDYVDNVGNVKVSLNGTQFLAAPEVWPLGVDENGTIGGVPTVSFNGALNNFFFSNADFPAKPFSSYFAIINNSMFNVAQAMTPNSLPTDLNCPFCTEGTFNPQRWSLEEVQSPSAVPLPAALPLMLSGLGMLGFATRRKS